jgi:hypothetical protein
MKKDSAGTMKEIEEKIKTEHWMERTRLSAFSRERFRVIPIAIGTGMTLLRHVVPGARPELIEGCFFRARRDLFSFIHDSRFAPFNL